MKPINLKSKSENIADYFSPKVIGEVNDVYVKLAKIKGEKVPWHNHTMKTNYSTSSAENYYLKLKTKHHSK